MSVKSASGPVTYPPLARNSSTTSALNSTGYRLAISASSGDPVDEADTTTRQCLDVEQVEPVPLWRREQRGARPRDQRVDDEAELVHQFRFEAGSHNPGATHQIDVLARLLVLQSCDLVESTQEGRLGPLGSGQAARQHVV